MQRPNSSPGVDAWGPETYGAFTAELDLYADLQAAVVEATRGLNVATVLDLGIGTGETTRGLLYAHRNATAMGIDTSQAMLDAAKLSLPPERTTLVRGRLEETLPPGPFDLVVSVLAAHHLDGPGKAALFARISDVLAPNGRFVLGDIVLDPQSPRPRQETIGERLRRSLRDRGAPGTALAICQRLWRTVRSNGHQHPDGIHRDHFDLLVDQIGWLTRVGLRPKVVWEKDRLVVVAADKLAMSHEHP
jgi:tRNA (cmo5U34)-methyltransferase